MGEKRPNYCLHDPHPDAAIEAEARAIYMARYGKDGGCWELNETPQVWWQLAEESLARAAGGRRG